MDLGNKIRTPNKVYTTTDNFTNSTNRLVKSKDGQVDTYLIRYIPSSTYRSNLRNSTDGKIEYDGYAQLLGEDGQLIFEQKIINGNSINQSTGCVPHILGEGGYWLCAANNKHSPEPCPVTCNNCDNDFTWVPFQVSILNGCNGGGGNNNNGDSSDNDTNNNGGGGGSGNNDNDNNDNNNNNNDSSNAPDLPTEPIIGGNGEDDAATIINDYLCQDGQVNVWTFNNWVYPNNVEDAQEMVNYLDSIGANNDCMYIDFEEKVIFDESFSNNPKIKCAYDKLKEAGGLRQLMDNFFDEDEDVILNFKVTPNLNCSSSSHPNGCTRAIYTGDNLKTVTIEISEDYINNFTFAGTTKPTPMLFLVRTLLHESIHANLYYALDQMTNGNNNIPNDLEFEILYELYRDAKGWQHNTMANHYLDEIAQGLEDVHPLLGDQAFINYYNNIPDWDWEDAYTYIAWAGLTETTQGQNLDITNNLDFSYYNSEALVNSNKNQNCQ